MLAVEGSKRSSPTKLTCVVNLSEGRRRAELDAIAGAAGDDLLDVHVDPHHHRAVLTLVGERAPQAVASAALDRLDLRRHTGAHPRLGVVDVVPFVDLDASGSLAVPAADRFATWMGEELAVPTFRYGADLSLPTLRRGAFSSLFSSLHPWAGPAAPHPTAGATAVGARGPLVAYNVWLADPDAGRARAVAARVRGPALRALGMRVGDRVQVSMNLVDPTALGPAQAYDAVASLVPTAGAELVGLVPEAVLHAVPSDRWELLGLSPAATMEARLDARLTRLAAPR